MWICFNDAFISIVEDTTLGAPPGTLKVRARKKEHLKALFPGVKIHEDKGADYQFRVFVDRQMVVTVVADAIGGDGARAVTYDNFKNSVKDDALHRLYANFWTLHYDYQRRSSK